MNLLVIRGNVIIHHDHNVFIRNTIFMENLVGMAYISLNTRKWTHHLKFSLKRASNYFHSWEVIMVTRRRTLYRMSDDQLSYQTPCLSLSWSKWLTGNLKESLIFQKTKVKWNRWNIHQKMVIDGIIINASQPSWPSFCKAILFVFKKIVWHSWNNSSNWCNTILRSFWELDP